MSAVPRTYFSFDGIALAPGGRELILDYSDLTKAAHGFASVTLSHLTYRQGS